MEKAEAEAAPWKSRLEMAWASVPWPGADGLETAEWLRKWDAMTGEDV